MKLKEVLADTAIKLSRSGIEDAARDGREWFLKWDREYTLSKAFKNKDKTKNACKWDLEIEA